MPLSRRQILARRRTVVFGALALVIGSGIYLPMTLLAPLPAVHAEVAHLTPPAQEALALDFPEFGASAVGAVGFDKPLAVSGSKKAVPIASITKVITMLVVLDKKPLTVEEPGPTITTTSNDVALYNWQIARNGSVAPVSPGLTFHQRDIMDLVLIKSANNYAETLVTWAFGSEDAYLPVARKWLAQHGLSHTSLADATGLSPKNRSTTTDLIALGGLALANPVVSEIVGTKTETVPNIGKVSNTNDLLTIDGIRGIKTGTTDDAGACLLFAADYTIGKHPVTVLGVMLGGADHPTLNARITKLLATVKASFHEETLISKGDPVARFTTPWGDDAKAVAATTKSVLLWADSPVTSRVSTVDVSTAERGTDVGDVVFTVNGAKIKVDAVLDEAIRDPGAWWRLSHPGEVF